jgi:hypothetical protein
MLGINYKMEDNNKRDLHIKLKFKLDLGSFNSISYLKFRF